MKTTFRIQFVIILIFLVGCTTTPEQVATSTSIPKPTKVVFLPTITPQSTSYITTSEIPLPPDGKFYHGVYPAGSGHEDVTRDALLEYEEAVGKQVTWVYFSADWYISRQFPIEVASWIREAGSIPFIRLALQSEFKFEGNEPVFTLQNIIDGQFDSDLHAWCEAAREFGTPILVEYGTEVNSDSFPWSGIENGGFQGTEYGDPTQSDGPERFRDAYRHIIKLCRDERADNITWVFHLDSDSYPDESWNKFEQYYPGDEWIDWIGISIYGTHTPMDLYYGVFHTDMERIYSRILKLAPEKPIIIAEFGTAKNNPFMGQTQWAKDALTNITSLRYKNLIGFSWWNEAWQNDDDPAHNTTMRVQDNPDLKALFKEMVGNNPAVIGEISR